MLSRPSIYVLFWENVVSCWGLCPRLRPRFCPWTPLGNFRPSDPLIAHPCRKKSCGCPCLEIADRATEMAGVDSVARAKKHGLKTQEWKRRHEETGVDNVGVDRRIRWLPKFNGEFRMRRYIPGKMFMKWFYMKLSPHQRDRLKYRVKQPRSLAEVISLNWNRALLKLIVYVKFDDVY